MGGLQFLPSLPICSSATALNPDTLRFLIQATGRQSFSLNLCLGEATKGPNEVCRLGHGEQRAGSLCPESGPVSSVGYCALPKCTFFCS